MPIRCLVPAFGFILAIVPTSLAQLPPVDVLIKTVEDPDTSPRTKSDAIMKLGKWKDKAAPAIPLLEKLVATTFPTKETRMISYSSAYALGEIGKPAVLAVVRMLDHPVKKYEFTNDATSALKRIGPDAKDAIPSLISLIEPAKLYELSGGAVGAMEALHAIETDPKVFVPALNKVIGHYCKSVAQPAGKVPLPYSETRKAISLLGDLGPKGKDGVPALVEVLKLQPVGNTKDILRDAIINLGRIGPEADVALPSVRRFIQTEGLSRQAEQAIALIKGGSPPPRRGK